MYTIDREQNGLTIRLADCKTMNEAVSLVEADRALHDGAAVYHIERDDGGGIGDEMDAR